jgi:hypothetical protein
MPSSGSPASRTRCRTGATFDNEEIDLFFANVAHPDGLERFGPKLIVEAKTGVTRPCVDR